MAHVRAWGSILCALLLFAACTDIPTEAKIAAGDAGVSTSVILPGVIVIGHPGGCDPRITECEDDGGWDSCASDVSGTSGPEMSSTNSCPGGGAGAGGVGDGGGAGDGGGPGGDGGGDGWSEPDPRCAPGDTNCDGIVNDGPMLWGTCVLGVAGGLVSVHVVGTFFETWYEASLEVDRAKRMRDMVYANAGQTSTAILLLHDTRLEFALSEFKEARRDVALATGASVLALAAAAVACSPALVLPTA